MRRVSRWGIADGRGVARGKPEYAHQPLPQCGFAGCGEGGEIRHGANVSCTLAIPPDLGGIIVRIKWVTSHRHLLYVLMRDICRRVWSRHEGCGRVLRDTRGAWPRCVEGGGRLTAIERGVHDRCEPPRTGGVGLHGSTRRSHDVDTRRRITPKRIWCLNRLIRRWRRRVHHRDRGVPPPATILPRVPHVEHLDPDLPLCLPAPQEADVDDGEDGGGDDDAEEDSELLGVGEAGPA